MSQLFVMIEYLEFLGDHTGFKVQEGDRPFCLTYDMNVRVIK